MTEFEVVRDSDPRRTPVRVALIRRETQPRVLVDPDETVMTAPHLLVREIILAQVCVIFLSLISLFFDAPLEGIADPSNTPNPAKAPWYFLGLQELLHYFPPVVAGVLIPGLVVIAIVVIPYFRVNIDGGGFLDGRKGRKVAALTGVTGLTTILLSAFKVWPVLVPTLLVYLAMILPAFPTSPTNLRLRLSRVPLSNWIMTWFVAVTAILTLIGIFFRGRGWAWVWPWQRGMLG